MEDIVIQVDVKDAIFFSEMKNYGKMRDAVKEFYSTYRGGTIYGLIGECGSGGWGISSLLCGKTHPDGSRVLINNIEFFSEELKKCGWYVGEGFERKGRVFGKHSVKSQIRQGLKITKKCTEKELIKRFGLSDRQLVSSISNLGKERWITSLAIGYAYDYRIFCFPWLNSRVIRDMVTNRKLKQYLDILKSEGAIVIIPTEKEDFLRMITDEIVVIINTVNEVGTIEEELVRSYYSEENPIREKGYMVYD